MFILPLLVAIIMAGTVAPASAITRDKVLARASSWVDRQVSYSQFSYFEGYRQDCSGFVSMAWSLDSSYTTWTIGARSQQIPKDELMPGDAVLTPGHVVLFVSWQDDSHSQFNAMEESGWRVPTRASVKSWSSSSVAIRLDGIEEAVAPPVDPPVVLTAPESVDATPVASKPAEAAPVASSLVRVVRLVTSLPKSVGMSRTAGVA